MANLFNHIDFINGDHTGKPEFQDLQVQAGYLLQEDGPSRAQLLNTILNQHFEIEDVRRRVEYLEELLGDRLE